VGRENACDASGAAAVAADLRRIEATAACWIWRGNPLRLDQFSGCAAPPARASGRTVGPSGPAQSPGGLRTFSVCKGGVAGRSTASSGHCRNLVWLTPQDAGCAWAGHNCSGFAQRTTALRAAIHEQRWGPRPQQRIATFAGHCTSSQETKLTTSTGCFASRRLRGLNFAGFSKTAQAMGSGLACCRGNWLERRLAGPCPGARQWALVESLDPGDSAIRVLPQPGGLGSCSLWDRDEDLLAGFRQRNPCLWAGPGAMPA